MMQVDSTHACHAKRVFWLTGVHTRWWSSASFAVLREGALAREEGFVCVYVFTGVSWVFDTGILC
jgi:hypothetical protein